MSRLSFLFVFLLATAVHAQLPSPPEVWADFDPDAGDFNEEIVHEETKDGVFYRDSYISAYILGEEVRVYCKYSVKELSLIHISEPTRR